MRGAICLARSPYKNHPHATPSDYAAYTYIFAVYKRGYSTALLYIYTQYAGTNPVLYNTLYILLYNYSLNYTLTNSWAGNMQTMQTLYITARPSKTAPNHSISVGLGDLYPHPVNVPAAAQNSQSGGRRIPCIGGI